ncbi:aromatic-ring-hydroxylating dioxygenase subunit beta [Achromobacter kerstersii]|uniref:Biphenyl dioxygenase subunit beta n=1 Tax=Achromobacter kerstersii TaxID=1353890 RepID=A0A6S6Z6K8_9BURK|nr:aromatic-ring-hydroxylating dioxygenase subunit beta [Achromobacter kerstersii]CAB3664889.1 Biphenyl dioxygenase subunit beta [Achromobacter kerstersii]
MVLLDRSFDVSIVPHAKVSLVGEPLDVLSQFIFDEAQFLDDGAFESWLHLWDEDGRYWVPRFHKQVDPFEQVSLFWEDKMLRELRVRRISNPRNWSQQPPTRTNHLVGGVSALGLDAAGRLIVRSSLNFTEWRLEQRMLAATVHHKLVPTESGGWRIYMKRVDLTNCDATFANLEVFI